MGVITTLLMPVPCSFEENTSLIGNLGLPYLVGGSYCRKVRLN